MKTMMDIQRIATERGSYFFTPDTMEFWGTLIYHKVWDLGGDLYMFITGEPTHPDFGVAYVLRSVDFSGDDARFETHMVAGELHVVYEGGEEAHRAAWN